MNPYMALEAVNTKILTKKSHILDEKKLEKIIECETVGQVTEFLKSKYNLKRIIERVDSRDLHRDDLETILNRYAVLEIEDILHYFSGPYREFFRAFLMKHEIADLTLIMRNIVKGSDMSDIGGKFIHSERFSSLPYEKLISAKSIQQFIDNLKNTLYYNYVKTVTDNDVIKREFHTEMKLQALFYRTLLQRSEKLEPADKLVAQDITGRIIDFLNIQWIYRARKYYDISPEEMLVYSLQGGKKLSFAMLKKLCYLKSIGEIRELSNKYLRYEVFKDDNDIDIEKNADSFIYAYVNKMPYKNTIGMAVSYIYMLDIVIKDLTTVTEGIRYKLPKKQLKKYLVRSI